MEYALVRRVREDPLPEFLTKLFSRGGSGTTRQNLTKKHPRLKSHCDIKWAFLHSHLSRVDTLHVLFHWQTDTASL